MYGIVTTDAGRAVLAQLGTGLELIITRVSFGSGRITSEKPAEQTDLIHRVADGTSDKPTADGTGVRMTVEYRNDLGGGLKAGFYINEYGVWGKAGKSGQEALILYASLGEHPQWIDAYTVGLQSRRYPLHIELSGDADVELSYQASSFLIYGDLGKPGGVAQLDDTGALPITQGGTGATTAEAARDKLGAAPRENLFFNWDFTNPVNQKEQTEYMKPGVTIDGWKVHVKNGGVQIRNDGLMVNAYDFGQQIPDEQIPTNTPLTFSVLLDTGLFSLTFMFNDIQNAAVIQQIGNSGIKSNFIRNWGGSKTTVMLIQTGDTPQQTTPKLIKAVKLEIGATSTLAHKNADGVYVLDSVQDYAAELLKCQRYFQVFETEVQRPTKALDFRPTMRVDPVLSTIVVDGKTLYTASAEL